MSFMASMAVSGAFLIVVKSGRPSANASWSKLTDCEPRLDVGWFPFETDNSIGLAWFKAVGTELGSI